MATNPNIIELRLKDLMAYRPIRPENAWNFDGYPSRTVQRISVAQDINSDIIIYVVFSIQKDTFVVVSVQRGSLLFKYTDAKTHEDVINTIDTLLKSS